MSRGSSRQLENHVVSQRRGVSVRTVQQSHLLERVSREESPLCSMEVIGDPEKHSLGRARGRVEA